MASDKRATRLGMLAAVGMVLFGALGARLWFLQTIEAGSLQAEVDSDHTRTLLIAPERGQIIDADGRLLAGNEAVINVAVSWDVIKRDSDRAAIFQRLSGWVGVPVEEMERRFDANAYSTLKPLPIAEDVSEETATAILERREDFPGVEIQTGYRRIYPYAPLAAHVVGYMGAITAEDADYYRDLGYDTSNVGEEVGRSGVEQSYETTLHGQWGRVVFEIDSHGNVVREVSRTEPVDGNDVQLSIDLDLQQYAERVLYTRLRIQRTWQAPNPIIKKPNGTRQRMSLSHGEVVNYRAPAGSVIVMDHSTGQVLAMASYPTYDNRWFGVDISGDKFDQLFRHIIEGSDPPRDDPDQASLTNRAIQGAYNLGSTFKPFVAYAGMMSNLIDTNSTYDDDGVYEAQSIDEEICATGIKCSWRNSVCGNGFPCRYGWIDPSSALAVSSDGFFYWLGERFFLVPGTSHELLQRWVEQFGFGAETGIDLPSEGDGRVPTNENKAELVERGVLAEGEQPTLLLGDVINMSIGQGLMAATPMQLAVAYGALANGGYRMVPHVVQAILAPGTPAGSQPGYVDLSRAVLVEAIVPEGTPIEMRGEVRDEIVDGLRRNVLGVGTEAHSTTAGELFNRDYNASSTTIPVAGKTGTAQGAGSYPWNDSSVFAAFSLDSTRPYTVVAYLEKSGYGSQAAAPVVKCVLMAMTDPTMLAPVGVSEPLDTSSDVAAEAPAGVATGCMARTDGDNVTPKPPQSNITLD